MPKTWLYYIALILPLALRVLILDLGFAAVIDNFHPIGLYALCTALKNEPLFMTFIGGWPYPVFVATVISWWVMDEDSDHIPHQFLLLPLIYVPFTVLGDILLSGGEVRTTNFFVYPLLILPFGYVYIFAWVVIIWLLEKLRLVL